MVDWKNIKKAAELADPDDTPSYSGPAVNPVGRPYAPTREGDRQRAFDDALLAHFSDPQSYKNAVKAGLVAMPRTVAKTPSALAGLVTYPTSWLAHGLNWTYDKAGLASQGDYERSKGLINKINVPVNWWNGKVNKYLPYPEEVENAPGFSPFMNLVEDIGAAMVPGATANTAKKIKDYFAFNPNPFRLWKRGQSMPKPVTRFTDPMKDPGVQRAFKTNGLDPADYRFDRRYVRNSSDPRSFLDTAYKKNTIHDTRSYRPGINVRSNGDGPRGNFVEADSAAGGAVDRSYSTLERPLWVAPRESSYVSAPVMSKPESSLSTLDNRFLVKWSDGSPVYVPDSKIIGQPFLRKLHGRGADIRKYLSRHGYHTGDPRVMRAYGDSVGWSPSKYRTLPSYKADPPVSHLDTLSEGVRIVPSGTKNPTSDVIDFAPNFGFNGEYKLRPLFTRKGYESAFVPNAIVSKPIGTVSPRPALGEIDQTVNGMTKQQMEQEQK